MKRCVKIVVTGNIYNVGYREYVKKAASKGGVEGSIQVTHDGAMVVYARATPELLDNFIDHVYRGSDAAEVEEVIIEAASARDFRGVFRIIGEE